MLDFYHASEYIGAAGKAYIKEKNQKKWLKKQENRLKKNKSDQVLDELKKHIDPKNEGCAASSAYK